MRQVLLQHALARQEEQERWRRLALAEAEAQHQAALATAASMAPATSSFLDPNYATYADQATAMPQWTGAAAPSPYTQPMPILAPNVAEQEEVEMQRALEESQREEEERKRRQAEAEEEERRAIAHRQRESEEEYYRVQQRQAAYMHDVEHQDEEDEEAEDEDEARRAGLEEAKQVQLALQLSLAEQKRRAGPQQQLQQAWDGLRAEGFADHEPSLLDPGGHHEAHDRRKGKEKVVDDENEDGGAEGESELAEALRLSQLVYLPPEARAREEQAIYRAALINEQVYILC